MLFRLELADDFMTVIDQRALSKNALVLFLTYFLCQYELIR